MTHLLEVENMEVKFALRFGDLTAIDGISFRLKGEVPTPIQLPPGCVFHGRCHHADTRCRTEAPAATNVGPQALVACHRVSEGKL